MRIGQGFDVHQFCVKRPLVIGGVNIPFELGLKGHSDADVAIHALCDALLGAAGLGDIGQHFPDTDDAFKNADSKIFLMNVMQKLREKGFDLVNCDITIIAQQPKLAGYMPEMVSTLAGCLNTPESSINLKATTTEHLGFTGRKEGIAAMAIALITQNQS